MLKLSQPQRALAAYVVEYDECGVEPWMATATIASLTAHGVLKINARGVLSTTDITLCVLKIKNRDYRVALKDVAKARKSPQLVSQRRAA